MTNERMLIGEFKDLKVGDFFLLQGNEEGFIKTGDNTAAKSVDLAKGENVRDVEFYVGSLVRVYLWDLN